MRALLLLKPVLSVEFLRGDLELGLRDPEGVDATSSVGDAKIPSLVIGDTSLDGIEIGEEIKGGDTIGGDVGDGGCAGGALGGRCRGEGEFGGVTSVSGTNGLDGSRTTMVNDSGWS